MMIGERLWLVKDARQILQPLSSVCRPLAWDPHADSRQFLHETISSPISLAFPLSATDAGF